MTKAEVGTEQKALLQLQRDGSSADCPKGAGSTESRKWYPFGGSGNELVFSLILQMIKLLSMLNGKT